jgi:mRNA interferase RelE/StbE
VKYRVLLRPAAKRDLRDLPREVAERILAALEELAQAPRATSNAPLVGDLQGLWKLRVGAYRAAYEVDDGAKCVRVWGLGHRGGFYERMRRRV